MLLTSLQVPIDQLEQETGWAIKPEGACKGNMCVPLPSGVPSDGVVDAEAFAERMQMPLLHDEAHGLWALGPEGGGRALTTAEFPELVLPDMDGNLEAARRLVEDGFVVLPYIMDDPVLALKLQDIGTATVMPLGSPIGSGQGMPHFERIRVIIEQARVPVVVDAGLGAPSDAAIAMELGADAVLVNTAIAKASNPVVMAEAFAEGVEAGRKAFLAGRIPKLAFAEASSPVQGVVR